MEAVSYSLKERSEYGELVTLSPIEEAKGVQIGRSVVLAATAEPGGHTESLEVTVTNRRDDGRFIGRLRTTPRHALRDLLREGSIIYFETQHILTVAKAGAS